MRTVTSQKHAWMWMVLTQTLVLLAALPALPASPEVVRASISSGGINVAAQVPSRGVTVSVSGARGLVAVQKSFEGRQSASLQFSDLLGEGMHRLPDGIYKWEATVIPTGVTAVFDPTVGRGAAEAEAFEKRGNRLLAPDESIPMGGVTTTKGLVQSGSFTVRGGSVVDSSLREPEGNAARRSSAGSPR